MKNYFDYEMKLIDEVCHSKFSFKKIIKLIELDAMVNRRWPAPGEKDRKADKKIRAQALYIYRGQRPQNKKTNGTFPQKGLSHSGEETSLYAADLVYFLSLNNFSLSESILPETAFTALI